MFKIGDEVRISLDGDSRVAGKKGRVVVTNDGRFVGVEFYEHVEGHSCDDSGREGYCWWVYSSECEKVYPTAVTGNITVHFNNPDLYEMLNPDNEILSGFIEFTSDDKQEFKIGDRVSVTGEQDGIDFSNNLGTILDIDDDGDILVEFDEFINGDTYKGCKPGHGWIVPEEMCEKINTKIAMGVESEYGEIIHDFLYENIYKESAYSALEEVLDDALEQSENGKGKERHANDNRYEDQVICVVQRLLKDHPFGGHAYQIIKKTIEAGRLYKIKGKEAAYQEMLGAINYASAMCILIKED